MQIKPPKIPKHDLKIVPPGQAVPCAAIDVHEEIPHARIPIFDMFLPKSLDDVSPNMNIQSHEFSIVDSTAASKRKGKHTNKSSGLKQTCPLARFKHGDIVCLSMSSGLRPSRHHL